LRWRRRGLLVAVEPGHPWWASHAQMPTVLPLSERLWRVYFGARARDNSSRAVAVDIDPGDGMRVVARHFDALLEPGPAGAFDQAGVSPSAALAVGAEVRLYYVGVSVRRDVRSHAAIGLAVSDDGLAFRRAFAGPVHGIGPFDPFFSSAPAVLRTATGYRMWYVGGAHWREVGGVLDPFYDLRATDSVDGLIWNPRSEPVLARQSLAAAGLGRPWITSAGGRPRLWFSRRGEAYRGPGEDAYRLMSVGADDGGAFTGRPEPVVFDNPPAAGDFDDWMQAYACVVPHGEDLVMLYNGNDFGRGGFGWAVLPGGARRTAPG
jgi:hypothetical protein